MVEEENKIASVYTLLRRRLFYERRILSVWKKYEQQNEKANNVVMVSCAKRGKVPEQPRFMLYPIFSDTYG
jgi:hypothetical protein